MMGEEWSGSRFGSECTVHASLSICMCSLNMGYLCALNHETHQKHFKSQSSCHLPVIPIQFNLENLEPEHPASVHHLVQPNTPGQFTLPSAHSIAPPSQQKQPSTPSQPPKAPIAE